ncbi:hypothetical protein FA13DRAFT_1745934 [Coprinellus micaceus]|uniref:Berberine/berberine-like domain-containing protein n=1 Tax=Coprinellus micaceus TaxID=71717 RepID=A0A4Y7SA09_COPMI|nr:hypothetical protein FA13DRAFT_1745934 [Coprinellus micaceus]
MARALELTLALSLLSQLVASIRVPRDDSSAVCSEIAGTISSIDGVSFRGSSSQIPASDVGEIVRFIGLINVHVVLQLWVRTRTPFACHRCKSGGHATNPGLAPEGVVEFGTGLRWGDVYEALEPLGLSVVGGRGVEVGVGGFYSWRGEGGPPGYSWKTNQYGLTIDTAVAFELVKPNGDVVTVSEDSDSELFFGLKGTQNNFGQTWGGLITYAAPTAFSAVSVAVTKFSVEVTDPMASMVSTVTYVRETPLINVVLFYDGPSPPPGIFEDFLTIPSIANTIGTQDSLLKFLQNVAPPWNLQGARARQITLPVPQYSVDFLDLVNDILFAAGNELTPSSLSLAVFVAEPFLPDILSHSDLPSAYPFDRSNLFTPCAMLFAWTDPAQDEFFEAAIKRAHDTLEAALVAEGHDDVREAPLYSNYALSDTPLDRIYGTNLPKLKEIKERVDPDNVMGLAGGFKV